jgi:hypothetical protein
VNHLEVTELPVYKPTLGESMDPLKYAERVRALVAKEVSTTQRDQSGLTLSRPSSSFDVWLSRWTISFSRVQVFDL